MGLRYTEFLYSKIVCEKKTKTYTPAHPYTQCHNILSPIKSVSLPAAIIKEFGYFVPTTINLFITKHLFPGFYSSANVKSSKINEW